jgi:hypothetical protein
MPIPHFVHVHRNLSDAEKRRSQLVALIAVPNIIALGVIIWLLAARGHHRKPPSIFDTPVDDVSAYLASADFNALSTKERLDYIQGMLKRFSSMNQSDSAVAAAFFAGLSGKASEQLVNNARTLGKDILVEGAQGFLACASDAEKDAFIDKWVVDWVRFADQLAPSDRPRDDIKTQSDQQILDRLSGQARHDADRTGEIKANLAQNIMDFWERDIASVASPKEQGQIFAFLPAVRDHMLKRGSASK